MINLFLTIIRALFALIDSIVVWLIKNLYVLLIQIANTNVFGDLIYAILGRIYVFLGIFMIFKLSMSMITYIINPDAMTDKSKGFGKLITNVVISLILIVTVPSIFREAFRLQYMILNENAIYQIITGNTVTSSGGSGALALEDNAKYLADEIAKGVFQSFIYKDAGAVGASTTSVSPPIGDEGECTTAECYVAVSTVTRDGSGTHGFENEYKFLLSTICGGVVAYFFLVFCLDAATRAIKLGVLQIIAPIPILSMIDPTTGNEKLKKWATNCGKEFAGLFIRLAGVFFATEVIRLILDPNNEFHMLTYYSSDGTISTTRAGFFVQLFIIIGSLMFAKQLPQFIENILGVKLSGDGFSLKKRLGSMPGMGLAKAAGAGALGFAGGMAANTWALGNKMWKGRKGAGGPGAFKSLTDGQKGFKGFTRATGNLFSGLAGGMSAAGRGAMSKDKNMFKAAGSGIKGAVDKRDVRDERQDVGYGLGDRTLDRVRAWAGVDQSTKPRIIALQNQSKNLQLMETSLGEQMHSFATNHGIAPSDEMKFSSYTVQTDKTTGVKTYYDSAGVQATTLTSDQQQYIDMVDQRNSVGKQIHSIQKQITTLSNEQSKNKK
ncbi:MAG: hypothetical protein E7173_01675 [Firmicutes bacterium]|nr:hypothetical protein [Bacillota bacterium]